MKSFFIRLIVGICLMSGMNVALALDEFTRHAFETPGLTRGEDMAPYSTPDVSFTTLSSDSFSTTYLATFAEPQNYIQFYWSISDPISSPDLEYQGLYYREYPLITAIFQDSEGNDLESFWGAGYGYNAGYTISSSLFQSVEFTIRDVIGEYIDRSGCVAGDISCGETVLLAHPTEISQFIYGIDSVAFPVPEPQTYAMMLVGLGLLVMRLKMRKPTVTA